MKTPDEIKKGLELCLDPEADCAGCPYEDIDACHGAMQEDVYALIQQLEADNAQQARCIENLTDKLNATNDALAAKAELAEQYRWERDVAINQLEQLGIGFGEKVDGKFPRWISVEERLPEKYSLVVIAYKDSWGDMFPGMGVISGRGTWSGRGISIEPKSVTHWMPLPEPPVEV